MTGPSKMLSEQILNWLSNNFIDFNFYQMHKKMEFPRCGFFSSKSMIIYTLFLVPIALSLYTYQVSWYGTCLGLALMDWWKSHSLNLLCVFIFGTSQEYHFSEKCILFPRRFYLLIHIQYQYIKKCEIFNMFKTNQSCSVHFMELTSNTHYKRFTPHCWVHMNNPRMWIIGWWKVSDHYYEWEWQTFQRFRLVWYLFLLAPLNVKNGNIIGAFSPSTTKSGNSDQLFTKRVECTHFWSVRSTHVTWIYYNVRLCVRF